MKTKLTLKEYILVASMLFGLFFGAGNLIFPVSMGQQAGSETLWASLGFCIAGVGLPLFGIAAMGISESKGLFDMSSKVGRGFAFFFTCTLYLTIGPLFAIPRTATVSFQVGVAPQVSETSRPLALCIFSALFFTAVLFFSLRPSGILTWVGKVLNPLFLAFLGMMTVVAFALPMGSVKNAVPVGDYVQKAFFTGLLEGYNTMDALASLAFGIILIEVIQKLGVTDPGKTSLCTIKSGVLSTLLMALIYCALAVMGAQSVLTLGISPDGGTALYEIAHHYFGRAGGLFLGVMITFACLKTSIGLVTACSTTFSGLFPKVCDYKHWAIAFSLFSFVISNAGLEKIIEFSLPVLLFLYPLTIVLILLCLFGRLFQYAKSVFVCTVAATTAAALLNMAAALPEGLQQWLPLVQPLAKLSKSLPFAGVSMGWVVPALAGCAVGCLIAAAKAKQRNL